MRWPTDGEAVLKHLKGFDVLPLKLRETTPQILGSFVASKSHSVPDIAPEFDLV